MITPVLLVTVFAQNLTSAFAGLHAHRNQYLRKDQDFQPLTPPSDNGIAEFTQLYKYYYFGGDLNGDLAEPFMYDPDESTGFSPFVANFDSYTESHVVSRFRLSEAGILKQVIMLTEGQIEDTGDIGNFPEASAGAILRYKGDSIEEANKVEEWINRNGRYFHDIVLLPYITPRRHTRGYSANHVGVLVTEHAENPRVMTFTFEERAPIHLYKALNLITKNSLPHATSPIGW